MDDIAGIVRRVKAERPDVTVLVDNCYGEFTETLEPGHVGADLVAGSLIKNPGGGLVSTGGYIVGKKELIERAETLHYAPGLGGELGSYERGYREFFQGFFLAPHTVAQALKTVVFASALLGELGYVTSPGPEERRSDIIQMISMKSAERLIKFCVGLQHASPVESYVTPEPWEMPGYDDPVIMAAGTFVEGASIELSADAPIREPFNVYLQGGLTYESGKLSIIRALTEMLD
jgi:cystathionine beta-lyase family protein involved in aluminum resistance